MLWAYRICFLPVFLVLLPGYLRRMFRRGGYRERFGERFGAHNCPPRADRARRRLWIQAVSVGEVLAIGPLLRRLRAGGAEVYLTVTTSTGYRLARERCAADTIGIGYFPLDWWPFSSRAWRRVDPDAVVLMEGERWPEHLHQASRRGVPVLCVNARLSDRSYRRLMRWPAAARLVLGGITRLLPASAQDERRFLDLGFPAECMTRTGNLKLDVNINILSDQDRERLRAELGLDPRAAIVVGASTWPGEEAALVEAMRSARTAGRRCDLLLVPRHAERRAEIEAELKAAGLRYHLRSRGPAPGPVDVAVADTTGELQALLQLSDLVYIGKSLPPHLEGQTPVEAATLGRPMLFGPGMGNFREISRDLLARGAAVEVADAAALGAEVRDLLGDAERRARLAAAAEAWRRENRGAVDRTVAAIGQELGVKLA